MSKEYASRFLFDEKIFISSNDNYLCLRFRIDGPYFLAFYSDTKEFEEMHGFGEKVNNSCSKWWKDSAWKWKEVSEEDENQITQFNE